MVRRVRRCVLPLALVMVATGCWNQYRGDWAHSGHQLGESTIGTNNVSTLGEAWTDATASAVTAAPSVLGDRVYVGSANGTLSVFDKTVCSSNVCQPLWTVTVGAGDPLQSSPAIVGTVVFVQGHDKVYAFDTATGTPLWTSSSIGFARSSPNVAYGVVFVSGANGLYAFDAAGCTPSPTGCPPLWKSSAFTPTLDASPTVNGNSVYVTDGSSLYAFDRTAGLASCTTGTPKTCSPRWRVASAGGSPALANIKVWVNDVQVDKPIAFVAGGVHGLSAYDAATGTALWEATLSVRAGEALEPPAVANDLVYLSAQGRLYAFDANGTSGCSPKPDNPGPSPQLCTPRWQTGPGSSASDLVTGAPLVANGVVYVGGTERLTAYSATGSANCAAFPKICDPLWATAPGGTGFASPVVVEGVLYAGSGNGLHIFKLGFHAPAPRISGIAPNPLIGSATTVTVTGTGFISGLTITTTIPGAESVVPTGVTPTSFTVLVTVPGTNQPGDFKLSVANPDLGLATKTIIITTTAATTGSAVALRAGIAGFPGILWEPAANRDADLEAIKNSGAKWTALDLDWKSIQTTSTDFGWTRGPAGTEGFDGAVKAARARGLNVLGIITYSPKWASPACADENGTYVGHCFPDAAHVGDFANFAAAAAAHYGPLQTDPLLKNSITNWQLWNEPNHQAYAKPRPDPDRYAAMVKAAFTQIRLANPAATVITGGTAPSPDVWDLVGQYEYSPMTWLEGLYDRGAQNSFDAIGHHPYSFPWNPLHEASTNAYSQTRLLYLIAAAHGDANKKVWGTEMGAPTGPYRLSGDCNSGRSMTELEQAQLVHDYYLGWNTDFRAFTGPLILKSIRDNPAPDPTDINFLFDYLGLLNNNSTPKLAYGRYQQITATGVSLPIEGPCQAP